MLHAAHLKRNIRICYKLEDLIVRLITWANPVGKPDPARFELRTHQHNFPPVRMLN